METFSSDRLAIVTSLSLLLSEVELMETRLCSSWLFSVELIASFIGSGINGNIKSNYATLHHNIASFIGSGINGNFIIPLESSP